MARALPILGSGNPCLTQRIEVLFTTWIPSALTNSDRLNQSFRSLYPRNSVPSESIPSSVFAPSIQLTMALDLPCLTRADGVCPSDRSTRQAAPAPRRRRSRLPAVGLFPLFFRPSMSAGSSGSAQPTIQGNPYVMTSDYVRTRRRPDGNIVIAYLPSPRTLTGNMTELRTHATPPNLDDGRGVATRKHRQARSHLRGRTAVATAPGFWYWSPNTPALNSRASRDEGSRASPTCTMSATSGWPPSRILTGSKGLLGPL
jgi:hypothetical protein